MVRKNCFDGLFCFKGDEVDNICVHKLDWTSTKTKEYLNKKKMVWKRLSKKVYFFFAIQFRRLVRLWAVTIKTFLMVKKKFLSQKILLTQNILRHENILKVRKILTTQNVSAKKIQTRQNNLVVQKILTSQNILLMAFLVKLLFTFSHSGKKWTAIFSLFLKIFPARGI